MKVTDNGLAMTVAIGPADYPPCSRCGHFTRIYGIEPHPSTSETDIRTYVCDSCETVEVRLVPLLVEL